MQTRKHVPAAVSAGLASVLASATLVLAPAPARAETSAVTATGELVVNMNRRGALAEATYTVTLKRGGEVVKTGTIACENGAAAGSVSFGDIADSAKQGETFQEDYQLLVTADKHLAWSQDLAMDGRCVHVDLYNYQTVNEGRQQADGLFGVMPVGDLDANGKVDDQDVEAVRQAIERQDASADLTGDGETTAADLAVVLRNKGNITAAPLVHTISSAVLASQTQITTSDSTTVAGDLSTLLVQDGAQESVTLAPTNDAPISAENPVEVSIAATGTEGTLPEESEAIVIKPPASDEANGITEGVFTVEGVDENGNSVTFKATLTEESAPEEASRLRARTFDATPHADVTVDAQGNITINLGQRVAVKRVTIRVTKVANEKNLAEIASVEFLSDFAERIPEPQLSIPTVQKATNTNCDGLGYKNLTVQWDQQENVTGYEVKVSGPGFNKTAVVNGANSTSYTFEGNSANGTIKSFQTYNIQVRSVSGDWRSDWSSVYAHYATATNTPPAPQNVKVQAGICQLNISWSCKCDAETYTLFYKKASESSWNQVDAKAATSFKLSGLEPDVAYEVKVRAQNRNGTGGTSAVYSGTPMASALAVTPRYALYNTENEDGLFINGIAHVEGWSNKAYTLFHFDGTTSTNSQLNSNTAANKANQFNKWASTIFDNQSESYLYINDWDSGVVYDNFRGPEVTFSETLKFDTVRVVPSDKHAAQLTGARIDWRRGTGAWNKTTATLTTKRDVNGRLYYQLQLPSAVEADQIQVRMRNYSGGVITISELRIYKYDSLDDDVAALFTNSGRTMVKDEVTEADVQALIDRANTPDPDCGEYHPNRQVQLAELNVAMQLVRDGAAQITEMAVDNTITATGNNNAGAQALSDYQPLGYVAGAGDKIVVYVEDESASPATRGTNVNLKLVATQMHPEVSAWQSAGIQLKAGRNEITIPRVGSYAEEAGGSLYVQYTGAKGAKKYTVRVTGATAIPTLRLDGVTGEARTAACQAYATELANHCAQLQETHKTLHAEGDNALLKKDYAATSCIANLTEIEMDGMMYSVPATQVNAVIKGDGAKLERTITAMEQEVAHFYHWKGLGVEETGVNATPTTRLNIRYHRMFTGAFMYAGGKHIGIEYGSVGNLFSLSPVAEDGSGGTWSGWGISHEIGHCINASNYQVTEVTNNLFAQICRTNGTNSTARASWSEVYTQLARNTGPHQGGYGVQLAMYWQLHLAYDDVAARATYTTAAEAREHLFYARMETYMRSPAAAPYKLTATSGDQGLMQAACAAANKDCLDFFRAWGMTPNAATVSYAAQYPKEERAIQYVTDDCKAYRMAGGSAMAEGTTAVASITNAVESHVNGNEVILSLGVSGDASNILGYEVLRDGKMVAFVTAGTSSYTDVVGVNNRCHVYSVRVVDKLLNASEPTVLPEVKVSHDGSLAKDKWTISCNANSPTDSTTTADDDNPEPETVTTVDSLINGKRDDAFLAVGSTAARPSFTVSLGGTERVTGVKLTPVSADYASDLGSVAAADLTKYRVFGYRIETSDDGENWTVAKEGNSYTGNALDPSTWVQQTDCRYNADGSYSIYLTDSSGFLQGVDCKFVRITATNMSSVALAEIDLLGSTGDNVELASSGFGKLSADFTYAAGTDASGAPYVIPAGSVVFYGEYKGDPAYNAVLLCDQDGHTLDGQQVILAPEPEDKLANVADGRWLYWFEPGEKVDSLGESYCELDQMEGLTAVRAELYRVQDAQTFAGQRLTAETLCFSLPETVPDLTITGITIPEETGAVASYSLRGGVVTTEQDLEFELVPEAEEEASAPEEAAELASDASTTEEAAGDVGQAAAEDAGDVSAEAGVEAAAEAEAPQEPLRVQTFVTDQPAVGDTGATSDEEVVKDDVVFTDNGDGTYTLSFYPADISVAAELVLKCEPGLSTDTVVAVGEHASYVKTAVVDGDLHVIVAAPTGTNRGTTDKPTPVTVTLKHQGSHTSNSHSMEALRVVETDATYFTTTRSVTGSYSCTHLDAEATDQERAEAFLADVVSGENPLSKEGAIAAMVEEGIDATVAAEEAERLVIMPVERANAKKVAGELAQQGLTRNEAMEKLVGELRFPQGLAQDGCDAVGLLTDNAADTEAATTALKQWIDTIGRTPTRTEAVDYLHDTFGYLPETAGKAADALGLTDGGKDLSLEAAKQALQAWLAENPGAGQADGLSYLTAQGFSRATAEAAWEALHPQTPTEDPAEDPEDEGQWVRDQKGWRLQYDDGTYAKSTWAQVDGAWYAFDSAGYMRTGWYKEGGRWYYLERAAGSTQGAAATGWRKLAGTWYYFNQKGQGVECAMREGWLNDGGRWYYLTPGSGAMATGWKKLGGRWYYLEQAAGSTQGAAATGWKKLDGRWYYLNRAGEGVECAMREGWLKDGGSWYYLQPGSGAMATGWQKVGGQWYYLKSSGAMATGWQQVGTRWYYLNRAGEGVEGARREGWLKDGDSWYYLRPGTGTMATYQWIGHWYVGKDGIWVQ